MLLALWISNRWHSRRAHAALMLTHARSLRDTPRVLLMSHSILVRFQFVQYHFFQILGLYVMFSLATLQFYFPEHFIPNPVALPPRGPAF